MNEAIKILKGEELIWATEYEEISEQIRLAKKYGKKSEIEDLREKSALIWTRLSMVMTLIEKLKAERAEA